MIGDNDFPVQNRRPLGAPRGRDSKAQGVAALALGY